jgi:aminoglycoside phosphotransferase (APT) family kinase protein
VSGVPEWDPERHVDVHLARTLIEARVPELRGAPIERLAEGWDNVVYLVDGRWVFRFPRREIAVPGVRREIATLERIGPHVPLPVPVPRWVGGEDETYPWPWFGTEHLAGVELAASDLPDERRVRMGRAVGRFLRALHGPMLRSRIGPTLPIDPMRRTDMAHRVPMTRDRLARAASAGLWQPTTAVEALLRDARDLPPSPRIVVLHGDLHVRHVLVDGEQASGVIDWGDVCAGDPSADLSFAYGALVGPARAAFVNAYGPVDGLTVLRARVIAVFLAAALLEYAADTGLAPLRAEATRALARAVA